MSESEDDVQYWGLSHAEAALYHARVARYWSGRAQASANDAVRYADRAGQALWFAIPALVLLLIMLVFL